MDIIAIRHDSLRELLTKAARFEASVWINLVALATFWQVLILCGCNLIIQCVQNVRLKRICL